MTRGTGLPAHLKDAHPSNAPACPHCGGLTGHVVDSRPTEHGEIRRRRVCATCHGRFSTFEADSSRFRTVVSDRARLEKMIDAASLLVNAIYQMREELASGDHNPES